MVLILAAVSLRAQTTNVVDYFSVLRGTNGLVLMTNAAYRCVIGNRVWFEQLDSMAEKGFPGAELDQNVLRQLGITLDDLEAAQRKLDLKNAAWRSDEAAGQARLQAAQRAQALAEAARERKAAWLNSGEGQLARKMAESATPLNGSADMPEHEKDGGYRP